MTRPDLIDVVVFVVQVILAVIVIRLVTATYRRRIKALKANVANAAVLLADQAAKNQALYIKLCDQGQAKAHIEDLLDAQGPLQIPTEHTYLGSSYLEDTFLGTYTPSKEDGERQWNVATQRWEQT